MTAEERAASFAEVWGLGQDARAALVELLHQEADETLDRFEHRLRVVAKTYDRVTEGWIVAAAMTALDDVRLCGVWRPRSRRGRGTSASQREGRSAPEGRSPCRSRREKT